MARPLRYKLVVFSVSGLLAAGTIAIQPPAYGSSSDRAFAKEYGRPGLPLDPVLSSLSAGRLVREVAALAPGQVEVPTVALGFALRGAQLSRLEVTKTPAGQQELGAFLTRLRSRGITPGAHYTVYALPSIREADESAARRGAVAASDADGPLDSALIVPTGTNVDFVGAVFQGGKLHAKTIVSGAPQPQRPKAAPSDSASFVRAGGVGCFHRKQNNTAWYDPCQEFWQLENDRDPTKGYWASQLWGTGKSKSIWTLDGLEVFARRTKGTAAQDWVDWDPGADADLNCQPQSVEVSYAGASVGITKQHCEKWDISKHEDVRFSNWWRGSVRRQERETAMVALTKTNAGEVPHQTFSFDFYAW